MTSWPNYCNDAKVWLPMTQAAHDAGNNRTLDVSGNGLHYRFGDGSTAGTFPTKLSGQRGYQFDGSNDYLEALENQTNAITEGTWAVFFQPSDTSASSIWCAHYDLTLGVTRSIVFTTATTMRFYSGDSINYAGISATLSRGANLLVGRSIAGFGRSLYWNGILSSVNSVGTYVPGAPAVKDRVGARIDGFRAVPGRIFWYGYWEYALSEIQLRDLESRLRKEFNNV